MRDDKFNDEIWFKHLYKVYKYMRGMEERKHLEPKFTQDYDRLVKFLKRKEPSFEVKNRVKQGTPNSEFFTETDWEFIEI